LDEAVSWFCDQLGFQLDAIWPADDPSHAVVVLEGLTLELRRASPDGDTIIVVPGVAPDGMSPPRGVRVEFGPVADVELAPYEERILVTHLDDSTGWVIGRAGMRYRDLAPGRLGGRYIASHIEIPDGGPVPDYVHHHDIRFQVIVCVAGWVRLVYEDQGEPFVLRAGECVLQPPGIRHRVLEASAGLEVLEVSGPAEHVTHRERHIELPTPVARPDREFGGQRFARHDREVGGWAPWRGGSLECQDTDVAVASAGIGRVRFVRAGQRSVEPGAWSNDDAELLLLYCAAGSATVEFGVAEQPSVGVERGSAIVVPPGCPFRVVEPDDALRLVELGVWAT